MIVPTLIVLACLGADKDSEIARFHAELKTAQAAGNGAENAVLGRALTSCLRESSLDISGDQLSRWKAKLETVEDRSYQRGEFDTGFVSSVLLARRFPESGPAEVRIAKCLEAANLQSAEGDRAIASFVFSAVSRREDEILRKLLPKILPQALPARRNAFVRALEWETQPNGPNAGQRAILRDLIGGGALPMAELLPAGDRGSAFGSLLIFTPTRRPLQTEEKIRLGPLSGKQSRISLRIWDQAIIGVLLNGCSVDISPFDCGELRIAGASAKPARRPHRLQNDGWTDITIDRRFEERGNAQCLLTVSVDGKVRAKDVPAPANAFDELGLRIDSVNTPVALRLDIE